MNDGSFRAGLVHTHQGCMRDHEMLAVGLGTSYASIGPVGVGTMQILFADDHSLFRESLAEHLRRMHEGTSVIQVSNLGEAVEHCTPEIDVVLLDLQMPGMNGLEGFDRIKAKANGKPVIVVS